MAASYSQIMVTLPNNISSLSEAEKFELLDALWVDLEAHSSTLTSAQGEELDRRVANYEKNPSDVVPGNRSKPGRPSSDVAGGVAPRGGRRVSRRGAVVRRRQSTARTAFQACRRRRTPGHLSIPAALSRGSQGPAARRRATLSLWLFFLIEPTRIVVLACFHGKRNPRHWRRR